MSSWRYRVKASLATIGLALRAPHLGTLHPSHGPADSAGDLGDIRR
jgi:hypothetical protein